MTAEDRLRQAVSRHGASAYDARAMHLFTLYPPGDRLCSVCGDGEAGRLHLPATPPPAPGEVSRIYWEDRERMWDGA